MAGNVGYSVPWKPGMTGHYFLQLSCDYDVSFPFPVCESCSPHKRLHLSPGENEWMGKKGSCTSTLINGWHLAWSWHSTTSVHTGNIFHPELMAGEGVCSTLSSWDIGPLPLYC